MLKVLLQACPILHKKDVLKQDELCNIVVFIPLVKLRFMLDALGHLFLCAKMESPLLCSYNHVFRFCLLLLCGTIITAIRRIPLISITSFIIIKLLNV